MNIGWLQDFLTAAESGNFTRAAAMRNSSQAAFSRRIQSLEAWLGVALFDRSVFPMHLTPQGKIFRDKAVEIVQSVADAKTTATGNEGRDRDLVRIAAPQVLATGRLPRWIAAWSQPTAMRFSVTTGSIHDIVTALVAGSVDVLIVFSNPQQPVYLASEQYERFVIGEEVLRPYASRDFIARAAAPWPGTQRHPVPMLAYPPFVYLSRMVDLIIENASESLYFKRHVESELVDFLCAMTVSGQGVAFLPDCALRSNPEDRLLPLGDDQWSLNMSVIAYIDRTNMRPAVRRLANRLASET